MTADTLPRVPTTIDESAITGAEMRIHPADMLELLVEYCFSWPGNAPRDVFRGTKLVEDDAAPLLPRKRL